MKKALTLFVLLTFGCNSVLPPSLFLTSEAQAAPAEESPGARSLLARPGQSMTLLPDGRWLLLGGEGGNGPSAEARVWDPQSGQLTFVGSLVRARTGHSSTVLPDGLVLIFGGIGKNEQLVEE